MGMPKDHLHALHGRRDIVEIHRRLAADLYDPRTPRKQRSTHVLAEGHDSWRIFRGFAHTEGGGVAANEAYATRSLACPAEHPPETRVATVQLLRQQQSPCQDALNEQESNGMGC